MTRVFTNSALDKAWPFWVLGVDPTASISDVEKAAQNIGAKLKLKVPSAEKFSSPAGQHERDEFLVREARAELQDPSSRLVAEFWYISPSTESAGDNKTESIPEEKVEKSLDDWLEALRVS